MKIKTIVLALAAAFALSACGSSPEALAKKEIKLNEECRGGDKGACEDLAKLAAEVMKLSPEDQKAFRQAHKELRKSK